MHAMISFFSLPSFFFIILFKAFSSGLFKNLVFKVQNIQVGLGT